MTCLIARSDIALLSAGLHLFDVCGSRMVQALMNWTSRVMVTSSPTRIPPVSSAAFQVRPKSLRLILVVAANPTRTLPHGSLAGAVGPSTANTVDCQLACNPKFPVVDADHSIGLEGQCWKLLHIKEIRTLEMRVALRLACVNGGGIDRRLNTRVGHVGFVEAQRPLHACELA